MPLANAQWALAERLRAIDGENSSLPPPVLPVLRAHLSDVSVAATELDFTSLPELAEDDHTIDATMTADDGAGDYGFDLLRMMLTASCTGMVLAATTIFGI